MSESTSCNSRARAALEAIRRGQLPPASDVRALGEQCPGDFFRVVIEALADSFDPAQSAAYDALMAAWDLHRVAPPPEAPENVDTVFVLSRVTLGADIKIVSPILDAMKRRYPAARIVFVAGRKSIELFAEDPRLEFLEAAYPRTGPVSDRIAFGFQLRRRLASPHAIVVDPDSRMTQLGLIPACDPARYFHFPSRTYSPGDACEPAGENLSDLVAAWLARTFQADGRSYVAPATEPVSIDHPIEHPIEHPCAALSLGVGENDSKRVPGDFEARLIARLAERFRTLHIDRGAGGEEARRVTAAVEASGCADRVRFHEGSFAGFVSIVARSSFYAGYDSAGQHAAAAAGVPLLSLFAGAPSATFRARWAPSGPAPCTVLDAETLDSDTILASF